MNKTDKYTDKDWEKIASLLSGESTESDDDLREFREEDKFGTEKKWNEMGKMGNNKEIDADKAWNIVYSRIEENGLLTKPVRIERMNRMQTFLRIAATTLIIIGLGTAIMWFNYSSVTGRIIVASNSTERNIEVSLPDGSKAYLNRNSEISYSKKTGKNSRNVKLRGEAFFDIKRDPSKPFIIDAGKAKVTVLGTSFSVLTNNSRDEVEVFVKTGSVLVTDNEGTQNIVLDPGFIGTMDSRSVTKTINENPNYLSWKTDLLVFEKTPLNVVFSDLKKVFDIEVVADDPEILNIPLTTTFEKEPQDTIIRVICTTFTGSYKKEGNVYHLSRK